MTMQMQEAFDSMMESECIAYIEQEGYYDSKNIWVAGRTTSNTIYAVIQAGNKFSQFDEGIARHAMEGGNRFSNYRNMYVKNLWPELKMNDKIFFRDTYYNILQHSDEEVFGFHSYIIEKDKKYEPNATVGEL